MCRQLVRQGQLVCFLNGAGGTGKSFLITSIIKYSKRLCENLRVDFDRRTIVVTALTGAAAVGIYGETTHKACGLNRAKIPEEMVKEWENTYMVIVDEISFGGKKVIEKLNKAI